MIRGIVIASPRTGSTFLADAMNSHPALTVFGGSWNLTLNQPANSLLAWDRRLEQCRTVKELIESCNHNLVIKMGYETVQVYGLWDYLRESPVPIIHLVRDDSMRKVLSELLVNDPEKRQICNIDGDPWDITVDEFVELTTIYESEKLLFSEWLTSRPNAITLHYERLIVKDLSKYRINTRYSRKICMFLDVQFMNLFASRKPNQRRELSYYFDENKAYEILRKCGHA